MKGLRIFLFIGILMCISSVSFAQTSILNLKTAIFQLKRTESSFFIPTSNIHSTSFKFTTPLQQENRPLVFKSPTHYTAFFCKMELKTLNALGIMIKVHAGDYDGYIGGCGYLRP